MLDTILETGDLAVNKKSLLYADFRLLEGANYSMLFASSPSVFVGQIELYIHKIKDDLTLPFFLLILFKKVDFYFGYTGSLLQCVVFLWL